MPAGLLLAGFFVQVERKNSSAAAAAAAAARIERKPRVSDVCSSRPLVYTLARIQSKDGQPVSSDLLGHAAPQHAEVAPGGAAGSRGSSWNARLCRPFDP